MTSKQEYRIVEKEVFGGEEQAQKEQWNSNGQVSEWFGGGGGGGTWAAKETNLGGETGSKEKRARGKR